MLALTIFVRGSCSPHLTSLVLTSTLPAARGLSVVVIQVQLPSRPTCMGHRHLLLPHHPNPPGTTPPLKHYVVVMY